MTSTSTREQLLITAERLIRTRGFSGFSYADLAEAVGIRKASIHHHFPAKADLGAALAEEYGKRFGNLLEQIDREEATAVHRIRRYAAIYETSVEGGMLCLCGMLATEVQVLPDEVKPGLRRFFRDQLQWLGRVLAEGTASGEFVLNSPPERVAEQILSTLEGATMVAWGMGDAGLVRRAAEEALSTLKS